MSRSLHRRIAASLPAPAARAAMASPRRGKDIGKGARGVERGVIVK